MSRHLPSWAAVGLAVILATAGVARAGVPSVAVDIAPVHSLVARVMAGVGAPDLIVPPGASPHGHSLRPSEARAMQDADLVFWVGPELTPWLGDGIATLAPGADTTKLLDLPGTRVLDFREGAVFGGQADHGDHAHSSTRDPHAWLDPENATLWLDAIAAKLSAADPAHADAYTQNVAAARAEMDALTADIDATLTPVRAGRFIVFHDAYRYFETAFDMPAAGAISVGDASRPGPARIAAIRDRVAGAGVTCVLAEPQFNPGLARTVLGETDVRIAVADPLGSALAPGSGLYPQLLRDLAQALADCL